jgi:hypothetical protein
MAKFNYYNDPGHGWVKVPRQKLIDLGILDKISSCSYQRGNQVYLEEDCDASHFVEAMKAIGKTVEYRTFYCNKQSKIRNYWSFAPYLQTST